jgi:hypothetical protein
MERVCSESRTLRQEIHVRSSSPVWTLWRDEDRCLRRRWNRGLLWRAPCCRWGRCPPDRSRSPPRGYRQAGLTVRTPDRETTRHIPATDDPAEIGPGWAHPVPGAHLWRGTARRGRPAHRDRRQPGARERLPCLWAGLHGLDGRARRCDPSRAARFPLRGAATPASAEPLRSDRKEPSPHHAEGRILALRV